MEISDEMCIDHMRARASPRRYLTIHANLQLNLKPSYLCLPFFAIISFSRTRKLLRTCLHSIFKGTRQTKALLSVHKLAIPHACLYRTTTFCYSTLLALSLMSIEYFQLWKLHAAIFRKINGFSYTKVTMKYKLPAISSTWFR